jgi:hypothetical protein
LPRRAACTHLRGWQRRRRPLSQRLCRGLWRRKSPQKPFKLAIRCGRAGQPPVRRGPAARRDLGRLPAPSRYLLAFSATRLKLKPKDNEPRAASDRSRQRGTSGAVPGRLGSRPERSWPPWTVKIAIFIYNTAIKHARWYRRRCYTLRWCCARGECSSRAAGVGGAVVAKMHISAPFGHQVPQGHMRSRSSCRRLSYSAAQAEAGTGCCFQGGGHDAAASGCLWEAQNCSCRLGLMEARGCFNQGSRPKGQAVARDGYRHSAAARHSWPVLVWYQDYSEHLIHKRPALPPERVPFLEPQSRR